jgi:hypothetical protein
VLTCLILFSFPSLFLSFQELPSSSYFFTLLFFTETHTAGTRERQREKRRETRIQKRGFLPAVAVPRWRRRRDLLLVEWGETESSLCSVFSVQTGTVSGVILCWVCGEMRDDSRLHSWFLCAGSLEETREIYSKVSAL